MATYDNKLLKGDQLVFYSGIIKGQLANKADTEDIPTKTSDLTNDSNFATTDEIPVNVSDLTNDSDFQTGTQVSTAITEAISGLTGMHFEIVEVLPETGEGNIIYLLLKSEGEEGNIYTEYAWINNKWEKLGDTQINLEYLTNTEVTEIWNAAV